MNSFRQWLIVIALWVLALGIMLHQMSKRFVIEYYAIKNNDGVVQTAGFTKKDTWTGRLYLKMIMPAAEKDEWIEVK